MPEKDNNFIKFLGTAGARYVVARQLRSSAGIWMNIEGKLGKSERNFILHSKTIYKVKSLIN